MKVIPPLTINDARLTSSNIPEPDTGEVAWNAATNYVLGEVAYRATTHKLYENLIAGVDATIPESAPTRWLDIVPTNKFAMFDFDRNSQSVRAADITVVITPGSRIGGIVLFGVEGETVTVTQTVAAVPVWSATTDLLARGTTTWSEYFYGTFRYKPTVAYLDIPMYSGAVFTIQITSGSGNVKCGAVVMGIPVDIGATQYNAESDVIDFSRIDRDEFGNATLIRRKVVPRTTQVVWMDATGVDKARKLRDDLASTPAAWCGLADDTEPYFDSLAVLGIFKRFTVQLTGPRHSLCTIELEGL
jgi:hypothetical protein